jgi:lysophospholipase L1-like esterase
LRQAERTAADRNHSAARTLLPLAVVLGLLICGELLCRAFVAPTRLDLILNLLERDPVLMWRLRADLNTHFEQARVRTNEHHLRGPSFAAAKPAGKFRVVCLGASPTFGWGVQENEAYPAVVAAGLAGRSIAAEVINGGVPGYTSWQGLHFLQRDVLAWSPDVVTVAYDLNDIDIFRFFRNDGRPDSAEQPDSPTRVAVQNALNRSASYRFFRNTLMSMASARGAFDPRRMPRRVSAAEYRQNLLDIERVCRAHAIRVIFVKMPIHLPFYRLERRNPIGAQEARGLGDEAGKRGDWRSAAAHYEKSYELDPTVVVTYRALAEALSHSGQPDRAQDILSLIPFAAAFSDRVDQQYNAIVENVARITNRPCVDVVPAFARDGRGDALWNSKEDPFHPNAAGHAIIGDLVAGALAPQPDAGR